MPTFYTYRYKIVTTAGEFNTSTGVDPMEDIGVDNWIRDNQSSINQQFGNTPAPVKVTAIYAIKGDKQNKIWGE
jgi:hypothetical protein